MSDKMRWRYGDTNPVVAPVDAATAIEIGDFVAQWNGAAIPYDESMQPETFLGVAMQRSREGDTSPIRVATTGVFEFDCASETFDLGDPVKAHQRQEVALGGDFEEAIARVAKFEAVPTTSVYVCIRSQVMGVGI